MRRLLQAVFTHYSKVWRFRLLDRLSQFFICFSDFSHCWRCLRAWKTIFGHAPVHFKFFSATRSARKCSKIASKLTNAKGVEIPTTTRLSIFPFSLTPCTSNLLPFGKTQSSSTQSQWPFSSASNHAASRRKIFLINCFRFAGRCICWWAHSRGFNGFKLIKQRKTTRTRHNIHHHHHTRIDKILRAANCHRRVCVSWK